MWGLFFVFLCLFVWILLFPFVSYLGDSLFTGASSSLAQTVLLSLLSSEGCRHALLHLLVFMSNYRLDLFVCAI